MKIVKKIVKLFYFLINWFNLKFNKVHYNSTLKINGILKIKNRGIIELGQYVVLNSSSNSNPVGLSAKSSFYLKKNAFLKIGNNVGISNSLIYVQKSVIIEDNVLIGGGCQIFDSDFHSLKYQDRIQRPDNKFKIKEVIIQEGAFIGCNSIILKGVVIGKHSIVGAGSIVSRDIPPNQIWAGNPAKFIKNG